MLGDLAGVVGRDVCKSYLSSDLHALSQDNSFRVRKTTVQYFGPICSELGPENAEKSLVCLCVCFLYVRVCVCVCVLVCLCVACFCALFFVCFGKRIER